MLLLWEALSTDPGKGDAVCCVTLKQMLPPTLRLQSGKSLGILQKLIKAKGLEQYAETECDPDSNPVEFALLIWCLSLGTFL